MTAMSHTTNAADAAARPLRALVEHRREEIKAVAVRHRASRICLFGSVVRGDEQSDSDIDFLVDFELGASMFDLIDLEEELRELLGHHVDIVSRGGLKPRDQDVLDEAIEL